MAEKHSSPSSEVKSANSWERADLGSSERNEKFLRLMGAKKKEHHGRIVIGDQVTSGHGGSSKESEMLSENLEEQYQQGLEHTLGGRKKHLGLGFHVESPTEGEPLDRNTAGSEGPGTASEKNGKGTSLAENAQESDGKTVAENLEKSEEEDEDSEDDSEEDSDEDSDDGPSPVKKRKIDTDSTSEQS